MSLDPSYSAAQAQAGSDPAASLSIAIMLIGILVVACAALAEAYSGRSNLITRALDRWSR